MIPICRGIMRFMDSDKSNFDAGEVKVPWTRGAERLARGQGGTHETPPTQ